MIPLGDAATLARGLRRAILRRKKRFIYPRFYALARWFPRIAGWLSARLAPRVEISEPALLTSGTSESQAEGKCVRS